MDEPDRYNEFGHTRCPRCNYHWRYMTVEHGNQVYCAECGHLEPATPDNSNEHSAAEFEEKSA